MKFEKPRVSWLNVSEFDEPSLFNEAYESLDAERKKRVERYRQKDDKKRSLAASVLLSRELSALGINKYEITYGEHGKPCLKDCNDIFFSLSHSGNYAVCAIYDKKVGIDVEKISEVSEKLIRKVATEDEIDFLMRLDETARYEQFARLWTAKESYVKRDGRGFLIPPTELSVNLSDTLSISKNGAVEDVSFMEITLSGYKITVCY